MKLQLTLRTRLVMLVIAALVPLFGLSIVEAMSRSAESISHVREELKDAASTVAASQHMLVETAHQVLTAIAHAPDVRDSNTTRCSRYLAELKRLYPAYANLGVIGADGYARCHGIEGAQPSFLGDRAYFREALARRSFVASEYLLGRLTRKHLITFALPMLDAGGQVSHVAYVGLDLEEMSKSITRIPLPYDARLTIVDRNGTLLGANPEVPGGIGLRVASPVVQEAVKTMRAEGREAIDGTGQAWLFAFSPSSPAADAAFFVTLSVPRDHVVGPIHRQLGYELAAQALVAFLGGWIAWVLGGSAIVKPAAEILEATRQLKNGRLDVRIPRRRSGPGSEFTRIADGFNLMADSLAQRQRDLEIELARSHLAYTTLDLTVNSMREGLIAVDTVGRVLLINEAASRLLVMKRAPQVLAGDWPQSQGLFKPGTGTLYAPEELPLYKALQGESGSMQHILVRNAAAPEGRLISASYRPMQGSEGVIGALVVFTDITGLQNLQLAQAKSYKDLRESEEKLREAQRLGRIGDWELDLASQTLSWSDEVYELFGVAPGSFDGRTETLELMVHPDDRARYRQVRELAIREGTELDMEYRIITPAGEMRWIHNLGRLYLNAQGQAQCRKGVVQDITKRKQSELALAASADLLRRTGEMAMIGGWALILDGLQTILSEQIYRIYEMDSDKVLTLAETLAFYAPQARPVISAAVQAAIEHGTSWDLELPMVTARGRPIWGRSQGQALAQDGKATQLVGTLQDITHRKLAEQAMLESEQRYTALFESAPVPMWVYDVVTWRFLMVNEAAVTTYGYSGEEFLAMEVFDLHPESEHARMRKRLVGAEPLRKAVWNHRRKDGSLFPGVVVSKSIQYAGRAARFVVSLDMIAQRKAENEVRDYLFTLQRAADAAQAITWHRTLSGMTQEIAAQARGVIGANQALLCLSAGGDPAQTTHALSVTESHAACWNLLDLPDITGLCASVFESNRSLRLTQTELESLALCRSAGESAANKLPAMRGCLAVALIGRDGKNIGLLQLSDKYEGEFTQQDEYVAMEMAQLASIAIENVGLLDEVNQLNIGLEQKVAERTAELTRQEALFRALAEEAPQVVWTANPRGQVTYVNRAWFVLMGGEEMADFGAATWLSSVHPEDLPDVQAKWQAASQGKSHYASIRRLLAKDGSYHTLSSRAAPVLDDQGEVSFWVGIDADITEIKAIEASLRLSNQELEAFSYSVSHDLRSPLNTIEGFSRLLVKQLTDDSGEKARHYLSRIQAGVAQMGQLIEDMLSLAQVSRAPLRHEPVDLTALAQGILAEWRGRAPERQVVIHIETGLQAHGDARLIKVVLENLLGNAWKFSSRRADAEISVGQRRDSAGLPVFFVRDNGAGFDMAYADKLFSPFQRLHAASEFAGTGVGLATVHRIIARHGGALWPQSAPDCGATFFFTLPKLPTLGG